MGSPKLVTISGSLRKGSYNRMLLAEAVRAFGDAEVTQADIRFPLYDGDLEDAEGIPEAVRRLAEQITQADALIIAAPEYNKGISGVLKNAIDWLSRLKTNVLVDKPTVVISAAGGRTGGETGQFMTMHCLAQRQVRLILGQGVLVAGAPKQFSEDGRLLDEVNLKALTQRMEKLRALIA